MLSQSADGIYYNNHEWDGDRNHASWQLSPTSWFEGRREMVVSPSDMYAYKENAYIPLPLEINGNAELPLEIGRVKSCDKVTVLIDFEGDAAPVISAGASKDIAGKATDPVTNGKADDEVVLTPHSTLAYELDAFETDGAFNVIFNGSGTVHYVNVIIDAQ